MALTVVNMYKWAWGASEFMSIIQVSGDAAYPNPAGYALPASLFSLNTFASTSDFQLQVPPVNAVGVWSDNSTNGSYTEIDPATGNVRMFAAAGTEIGNGATAVGTKVALVAFGH